MATQYYNLNTPIIGGDENTWGTLTNDNWDAVDGILKVNADAAAAAQAAADAANANANTKLPLAGGVMTGAMTVLSPTGGTEPMHSNYGDARYLPQAVAFYDGNLNSIAPTDGSTVMYRLGSNCTNYPPGLDSGSAFLMHNSIFPDVSFQTVWDLAVSTLPSLWVRQEDATAGWSDWVNQNPNPEVSPIKAWGAVNGSNGAVLSGDNITVTRNGAGNYTVNFQQAMSSSNYSVTLSCSGTQTGSGLGLDARVFASVATNAGGIIEKTTTALRVAVADINGVSFDPLELYIQVME